MRSGFAVRAGAGRQARWRWLSATLAPALFVMGFVYGPLGAWMPRLFPVRVRYTGDFARVQRRRHHWRRADADRGAVAERGWRRSLPDCCSRLPGC